MMMGFSLREASDEDATTDHHKPRNFTVGTQKFVYSSSSDVTILIR
jgi:hypothetical protein